MGSGLDQKRADQLARLFNVAFNSAGLYGGQHPTTTRNVVPLFDAIKEMNDTMPALSFIVDRGSLFIEDACVDKMVNPKRIISQFTKAGLESVTFERGVQLSEVITFISLSGDNVNTYRIDEIEQKLADAGCTKVKLNYVRFDMVMGDQVIVDSGCNNSNQNSCSFKNENGQKVIHDTSRNISEILSLAQLLEKPQETAQKLSQTLSELKNTTEVSDIFSDIKTGLNNMSSSSLETLLGSIYQLKSDLSEAIEVQKLTGNIISGRETVSKQFDELSCEVIVKLILQEYKQGIQSLKRLAQIIRRMLPDHSELKMYLPKMKEALLAGGMPLHNYLELLRLLNIELEGERLAGSLSEAAGSIGVTEKELIAAIEAQPQEAARLIYLASEIRKSSTDDDTQLSNLLAEYVEKVSTGIAVGFKGVSGPQGSKTLRKALMQLEKKLVDQLKKYGVDEKILFNITRSLSSRFESVFDNAASKWIRRSLLQAPDKFVSNLAVFLENENEISRYQNSLSEVLESKNYSKEQIDQFIKTVAQNVSDKKVVTLPSGILSSNNIIFLLDREIKQNQRYKTPFSTIVISIKKLVDEKKQEVVADKLRILSQIFIITKKLLRDIDLIGSLDDLGKESIFILLSMTDPDGARVVKRRIYDKVTARKFSIGKEKISIDLTISITSPQNGIKTYHSYLDLVRKNHKESQKIESY